VSSDEPKDDSPEPSSGPPTVHGGAARFWLDYRGHQFELRMGEMVLGRSAGCQIVLDDALVSRRHARIVRSADRVELEDLGSANGVLLNGARVAGRHPLQPGDEITIGQQRMVLRAGTRFREQQQRERFMAATLSGVESSSLMSDEVATADSPDSESTHRGNALTLLGGVADKVLALGRGDEAEKILGAFLENLINEARTGRLPDLATATKAVEYAVKLAAVMDRAKWVDYCVEFYTLLRRPMPADVIDALYGLMRRVRDVNRNGLRLYLKVLHARQDQFGPAERFLLQRIEGLERLATL
jgi:pSer/pThr/pTyr-binding forkhead associated (FHA) protein